MTRSLCWQELFGEFGSLMSASVHFDSSGTSLGSAQVYYSKWASAVRAKQQYNGVHLDRRPMRVSIEGESTAGEWLCWTVSSKAGCFVCRKTLNSCVKKFLCLCIADWFCFQSLQGLAGSRWLNV